MNKNFILYLVIIFLIAFRAFGDSSQNSNSLQLMNYYENQLSKIDNFIYLDKNLSDITKDISKKYGLNMILDEKIFSATSDSLLVKKISIELNNVSLKDCLKELSQKANLMYAIIINKNDGKVCFYTYNHPYVIIQ